MVCAPELTNEVDLVGPVLTIPDLQIALRLVKHRHGPFSHRVVMRRPWFGRGPLRPAPASPDDFLTFPLGFPRPATARLDQ